jgi:hypothetical protein
MSLRNLALPAMLCAVSPLSAAGEQLHLSMRLLTHVRAWYGRVGAPAADRECGSVARQCNKPNTATPAVVPTNTLPSATAGVMNLLPVPK